MIIDEDEYFLSHIGTPRHSGRYPYGSGENPNQRHRDFLGTIESLRAAGVSETDIYRGMNITSTEYRAKKSIAKNAVKAEEIAYAQKLRDAGHSNVAIGQKMGRNESSVRSLLADGVKDRADILQNTANMLRDEVDSKGFIDVGGGVENQLNLSKDRLETASKILVEEGYALHNVQIQQQGTANKTTVKVLAPPGTTYKDIVTQPENIRQIQEHTEDGGRTWSGLLPPLQISTDRVGVNYEEDGGGNADGLIYVRPGVKDISLGGGQYAQVRVGVNGTHYLKGMAIYKDDLPEGVDLVFNTNKKRSELGPDKLKAMKDVNLNDDGTRDDTNPFGAAVRQIKDIGPDGKERVTSAMNIVNEQGDWDKWSKNLSTQMLSKQSPRLAKTQLDMTFENKKADLDEILGLTNPTVRRKLLDTFADEADSSAVHLKAAAMPRQRTQVIIPVDKMKDTEVYAPNFRDGERVALVRYPHGGKFEIPELTVNNRQPDAKKLMGQAPDAIAINAAVAKRLSGADFDGDTVLVIPNNRGDVASQAPLAKLKNFDPQRAYPGYEGMTRMDARVKGFEMGDVSNLITDMTIRKANDSEIADAVRHSMVVIDAEKHGLNWRQSAKDHNIATLKAKYQRGANSGASTLISQATSQTSVPERKRMYRVDPKTGKKVWTETGGSYEQVSISKRTGEAKVKTVQKVTRSVKLAETDDAHTLSSGTPIEKVYADHSNRLKAMANTARKESVNTKTIPYSPSAYRTYKPEVDRLNSALNVALKNRPRERQAQIVAGALVKARKDANPDMTDDEYKKVKGMALIEARARVGAKKEQIEITPREWEAIQNGAITNNKLTQILNNADIDSVKQLATPKTPLAMSPTKMQRASQMLASGYTQADVADALGVSVSTLKRGVSGEDGD